MYEENCASVDDGVCMRPTPAISTVFIVHVDQQIVILTREDSPLYCRSTKIRDNRFEPLRL